MRTSLRPGEDSSATAVISRDDDSGRYAEYELDAHDLRLDAERIVLSPPASAEVVIAVGIGHLADDIFTREPPTPVELERGIDVIEDALMAAGLQHHPRGELATSDAHLHALMGREAGSAYAPITEVEALFQRMAAISLGSPVRPADPEFTRSTSAALLILRECMHRLGYSAVRVDASRGNRDGSM